MGKYVLVIDEGTTGTRALIFDSDFNIAAQAYQEFTQYTPPVSYTHLFVYSVSTVAFGHAGHHGLQGFFGFAHRRYGLYHVPFGQIGMAV